MNEFKGYELVCVFTTILKEQHKLPRIQITTTHLNFNQTDGQTITRFSNNIGWLKLLPIEPPNKKKFFCQNYLK